MLLIANSGFITDVAGSLWQAAVVLFGLALLASGMGFWRTVYFISIGYGLAVATIAVAIFLLYHETVSLLVGLQLVGLLLYVLRLSWFLLLREAKAAYRKRTEVHDRADGISWPKKFFIWLSVLLLYVMMTSPCSFTRLAHNHLRFRVWQSRVC